MPLTTSSQFASVIETGTNWRDTAKKALEQLESVRTDNDQFNFGFLYVSDHLAEDLPSILNIFKSVLNIENWTGAIGMGVCGNGIEHIDQVAISVMIGHFDDDQFCFFANENDNIDSKIVKDSENWLQKNDPMLILAHGDPMMPENPVHLLKNIETNIGGFTVGGLSSSRKDHGVIIKNSYQDMLGGVLFSDSVIVATSLSQGCQPIGKKHVLTKCHENTALSIDDQPALDVFENDLRMMAIKKANIDPNTIKIDPVSAMNPEGLPEEYRDLFQGEVHAAFPVAGSDQDDYLVRNITGIDEDQKCMDIAHIMSAGDQIMFVHRDDESVRADLSKKLLKLRERVTRDHHEFRPKGALYISCVARAFSNFSENNKDSKHCGEMALVKEVIGDVPLTGFYASGEINASRLYGYTGILILFL